MPKRVALTSLQGKTIDIINTIRANASAEYQDSVPFVESTLDIPKVGEVLFGTPAMMNTFVSALMNRIAKVQMYSATFNNKYAGLKKGMLEYGETVEEIFTELIQCQTFDPEKSPAREFKRYLPKVHTAFHIMNWKVQYPLTVERYDLKQAFLSADGVENFIMNLIDRVYTSAEYDEYLLFKYLLIKTISSGEMKVKKLPTSALTDSAVAFRGTSNLMEFIRSDFNTYGVRTSTPKARQHIFMDTQFNSSYDVNVLASAFNMDKVTFSGKLQLIDDWTTFDNERWAAIRQESDMIEEVTEEELALCANIKAVLIDENWFQIYDNLFEMTEKDVASGMYWNYFLNTWKTVSYSPFANAVVFVDNSATTTVPNSLKAVVTSKVVNDVATMFTVSADVDDVSLVGGDVVFEQTEELTADGISVSPMGAIMIPANNLNEVTLVAHIGATTYTATTTISTASDEGDEITLNKGVA